MIKSLAPFLAFVITLAIFCSSAIAKPYHFKNHKHFANIHKYGKDLTLQPTVYTEPPQLYRGSSDVVQTASNYDGMSARANRKDLMKLFSTTFTQPVDPTVTPWCAAFVNSILTSIGMHGTDSLQAESFLNWGKGTTTPQKNDVVLLSFGKRHIDHVGFYVEKVNMNGITYVKVYSGNQSRKIQMAYFPVWQVVSYRTAS